MDKNVRALTVKEWSANKLRDNRFVFRVYCELDKAGLFPPGMDKLSVETQPCFLKMAASGMMEGPTVMAVIKKIVGAYERTVAREWDREDNG